MPSTVGGLIIFVTLLVPGFVFQRRWSRDRPVAEETALHEVLTILFAGLMLDVAALVVLGGAWWALPGRAIDPGRLILDPAVYVAAHPVRVAGWAVVLLVIATAGGGVAAARRVQAAVRRSTRRSASDEPYASAWWQLFEEHVSVPIHVGCFLTDGGYLGGRLHSYSRVGKESGDRELTLRDDITYRSSGDTSSAQLLRNVGAVSVSARNIQFLTVTYLASANSGDDVAAATSSRSVGVSTPTDPAEAGR
ncbi:DUF6338 family protein [Actinosynnema sp. NPDC047251]|uniref:Putative membrane protein n=1 Tax=Saccharothrix espanaensis (strain ATCC 51144 / DSM 44229 / JCM 9112 / NBRC 15066 / NRRL 15764) TaxID=1179773 RepID=K0JVG2_SACES|nr:DUF6338 family protein [Saccharothrix espanaensis]CCH29477.1 putative membrane protein [Saccharothrix espanaensis DSM 44229]